MPLPLVHVPPWFTMAACRGKDPRLFFPDQDVRYHALVAESAKQVCATCPVEDDCLAFALASDEHGIWGGTTDAEREVLRRRFGRVP